MSVSSYGRLEIIVPTLGCVVFFGGGGAFFLSMEVFVRVFFSPMDIAGHMS